MNNPRDILVGSVWRYKHHGHKHHGMTATVKHVSDETAHLEWDDGERQGWPRRHLTRDFDWISDPSEPRPLTGSEQTPPTNCWSCGATLPRPDKDAEVADHPKWFCAHCGKPAACFGSYEGSDSNFACDECCGHGREDGNCIFINGENE